MPLFMKRSCLRHSESTPISKKHPRFYFPDGNVLFRVEDTLYRIHKYFFQRDSPVFGAMFSLPVPNGEQPEGDVDGRPIHLDGIQCVDFDRLLSVMYPKDFNSSELFTVDEWQSVLKLSSQWDFDSLRKLAIKHIGCVASSADLVLLGHKYDVSEWLLPHYISLCSRDEPLTLQEGRKLGVDTVITINQIRSQIRYRSNLNRHQDAIAELVQSVFITPG
ncbi:hypothetical protein F5878DRAFT_248054 [Lentinula raphanica]|uniref:BTB domain-containing protein n=1 Tax=Lentinula raphanica TaxID=153919 RepID=A0AA38P5K5_9AGAR|nr:hypothetical protein F5880DRAFT_1309628 [Lentinula raphanica]KAJ3836753.1 hypothetical protein F5878DRAFT_248054 [Lentinula raphanica]